jgi:hypothetical protein
MQQNDLAALREIRVFVLYRFRLPMGSASENDSQRVDLPGMEHLPVK